MAIRKMEGIHGSTGNTRRRIPVETPSSKKRTAIRHERARMEHSWTGGVIWTVALVLLLSLIGHEHYRAAIAYGLVLILIILNTAPRSGGGHKS